MKNNDGSRIHFSEKARKADGRKNIDDVWWVSELGRRRKELQEIDEEIGVLNGYITNANNRIGTINGTILKRQNDIQFIKAGLKYGAILACGVLTISVLGAGFSEGFEIWCGLMLAPTVVGVSAKMVQGNFENEIVQLEEDKCIEEIDLDSYQRKIDELNNKKEFIKGASPSKRMTGSHEIVERPMCVYYQFESETDLNDYNDEVFQVGGTEPHNWTADKLIKRITSQQSLVNDGGRTKTR